MSEQDNEELDSQDQPTEEVVNTEEVNEPVADTGTEDLEKLKESNKRLFERTKKAEADLKALKAKEAKPDIKINSDSLSREEAILIAQGMEADDLDELKAVAEAKGLSLLKAKETPLFQGYLEKIETERKKEKAKLSASKGSQTTQAEKSVSEMTPEEHKEFFKETMKNVR
jgi:hypothetical protein